MAKANDQKDVGVRKACFIIMPITAPKWMVEIYRDGKDHFDHVLETLFLPAIDACGLEAIPPFAEGADNIHARIIQNLETADLVLCDISSLNPNVFFELGCRTALNKPVCYVRDSLTQKIPFDNIPINHLTYGASLDAWALQDEVAALAEHIKTSFEGSPDENTLWKWFGMKANATPPVPGDPDDDRFQLLSQEMNGLRRDIHSLTDSLPVHSATSFYQLGGDEPSPGSPPGFARAEPEIVPARALTRLPFNQRHRERTGRRPVDETARRHASRAQRLREHFSFLGSEP